MIRGRSGRAVLAAALLLGGCGGEATGPELPPLTLSAVEGDGLFVAPGQTVTLIGSVRRAAEGTAYAGAAVAWSLAGGDATLLPGASVESDAGGVVSALLRVGSTPGPVRVEVSLRDQPGVGALFELTVASAPVLRAVTPAAAPAGEGVALEGAGFSPSADQNVVLFGGIRAEVTAASPERLEVRVPECLAAGSARVDVRFGGMVSAALAFDVTGGGGPGTDLALGAVLDLEAPAAPGCLRLEGGAGGADYLMVAASTSSVGAARYGFTLAGAGVPTGAPRRAAASGVAWASNAAEGSGHGRRSGDGPPDREVPGAAAARWEAAVRAAEAAALRSGRVPEAAAPRPAPTRSVAVPAVGEKRTFTVLNADRGFDEVRATARHVGRRAVLYVDDAAPTGGFSAAQLADFAARFDEVIHPVVTERFGAESDLDGNGRVVVLFTATVNRLTPRDSDGFVAGFFYGVDLLPDREGSNGGEVFYTLVPDPEGTLSDPHPVAQLLDVLPPVLAHEFQHMVHFNQRVLVRGAASADAVWLSEGLAQMAEEVVARRHLADGDADRAETYRKGNRIRARRYLTDPGAVSLLIGTGQGSLEERGAAWLFLLYLSDLLGEDVLGRLTRTTRVGTDNVRAVAGRDFGPLLMDWWSALALDDRPGPGGDAFTFRYPGLSLDALLGADRGPEPRKVGPVAFLREGSLWSASAAHFILQVPASGSVALRLGGAGQGAAAPGSALRLRVVRLR